MSENLNTTDNLNNEMRERRSKLEELRSHGQAYPNDFRREVVSSDILAACRDLSDADLEAKRAELTYTIAGRIMTRRIMGKASFVTLQDMGGRIQLYVTRDSLPEGQYQEMFKKLDLGDIIGITG